MSYYKILNLEHYFKMYKKSIREPRKFWDRIADENFTWYQKWDKVFEVNFQEARFKWFLDIAQFPQCKTPGTLPLRHCPARRRSDTSALQFSVRY